MLVRQKSIKFMFIVILCNAFLNKEKEKKKLTKDFKNAYIKYTEYSDKNPKYFWYAFISYAEDILGIKGLDKNEKSKVKLAIQKEYIRFAKFHYYVTLMNNYFNELVEDCLSKLNIDDFFGDRFKTFILKNEIKKTHPDSNVENKIKLQYIRKIQKVVNDFYSEFCHKFKKKLEKTEINEFFISNQYFNNKIDMRMSTSEMDDIVLNHKIFCKTLMFLCDFADETTLKKFEDYAKCKYINIIYCYNIKRYEDKELLFNTGMNYIKCLSELVSFIYDNEEIKTKNINLFEFPENFDFISDLYNYICETCGDINMCKQLFKTDTFSLIAQTSNN